MIKVSKNSPYPELEIFEHALASFDDYFSQKEDELWEKRSDPKFDYNAKSKELREKKEKGLEFKSAIVNAMRQYESAVREANVYESAKLQSMVSSINDKKILKSFEEEQKKITGRKLEIKKDLLEALQSKTLKNIPTGIRVVDPTTHSIETKNVTDSDYRLENGDGTLSQVMQSLGDTNKTSDKIVNQFVERTEVQDIRDKSSMEAFVNYGTIEQDKSSSNSILKNTGKLNGTYVSSIYVNDPQLQAYEQRKAMDKDELRALQEQEAKHEQPLIDVIDKTLNTPSAGALNVRKLKITREELLNLANIDLEIKRVEDTISILDNRPELSKLYPNTKSFLNNYYKKLLMQKKKQIEKTEKMKKASNIDYYEEQLQQKKISDAVKARLNYLENKVYEYKSYGNEEEAAKYQELMKEELEAALNTADKTTGHKR